MHTVVIVDDHKLFSNGISRILNTTENFQVLNEFQNGYEFLDHFSNLISPDIVIIDLLMPDIDGFALGKLIRKQHPSSKIIVCSMLAVSSIEEKLVSFEPEGILSKSISAALLEETLNRICIGEIVNTYLEETMILPSLTHSLEMLKQLSDREKEIIKYLKMGFSAKKIAESLFISVNTVNNHKANIYAKLNVNSITQLLQLAQNI